MKKKAWIVLGSVFLVLFSLLSYKFIRFEIRQNEKIAQLNEELLVLSSKLENKDLNIAFSEDSYNYLAIGNSITIHGICDYWWSESGMAASRVSEDYFHKICAKLEDTFGKVESYAYNFSIWEIMANDRAESLAILDFYLDEKLDLITVQLGENVSNLVDFEGDFEYLLEYITQKVPGCEIIVIGDFWENGDRDSMKERICSGGGWKYVSLNEIKNSPEYECGMNTIVYDENGNEHTVTHSGVALHPNDKGMTYIAEAVFQKIED